MSRTKQQQKVISTVCKPEVSLVKIKAAAGTGKTFTLVELANELQVSSGIYLAYNKAIAEEAAEKFKGTNVMCSTLHSLAWKAVVRQYGLKVGYFGINNIQPKSVPYKTKACVVDHIEEFCLSAFTDPDEYIISKRMTELQAELFMDHLNKMTSGEIMCNHSFYLKLYHVFLKDGTIQAPKTDLLLIDEGGDLTPITIDIAMLIDSPKKVIVGDPMQNIYSFNNTVNAFEVITDGVDLQLTESFRVSASIAKGIQSFVRKFVSNDFVFEGHHYSPEEVTQDSEAYIARNNSALVSEMLRLKGHNIPFKTTRPIDTILEAPLIFANLDNGIPIKVYKYKHIEKLRAAYYANPHLRNSFFSPLAYVKSKLRKDDEDMRFVKFVENHGKDELNALRDYVVSCAALDPKVTLSTAHSVKGLEFCKVMLANDMNEAVLKALVAIKDLEMRKGTKEEINAHMEELRLYYVAASRAKHELVNAKYVDKFTV